MPAPMFQSVHIKMQWDDPEQTILIIQFAHGWMWEEYFDGVDWIVAQSRERGTPLEVITLGTHVASGIPRGAILSRFRAEVADFAATGSRLIHVRASLITHTLSHIYEAMFPEARGQVAYVATLDEARQLIAQRRADAAGGTTAH
jgi:hypothetical protein